VVEHAWASGALHVPKRHDVHVEAKTVC